MLDSILDEVPDIRHVLLLVDNQRSIRVEIPFVAVTATSLYHLAGMGRLAGHKPTLDALYIKKPVCRTLNRSVRFSSFY